MTSGGQQTEQAFRETIRASFADIAERVQSIINAMDAYDRPRPSGVRDLLMELEGLRTEAYQDTAGHLTIGIGHKLTPIEIESRTIRIGGSEVRWELGISSEQASALLSQDIQPRREALFAAYREPLTSHQQDALLSFIFNVGESAFKKSTLLKRLQNGALGDIPNQFNRWVYSGKPKKIDKGLVNRRAKEIAWWLNGSLLGWENYRRAR